MSQQSPQGFNHYRPDIDGLRAIAVLLVVGFHAFPEWVTGGFIGVDIFFVISGFLITGIINNSQGSGTFRYTGFYARRIRRIFPALIVVLLAIALFGYLALLPDERIYLGIQIVSGAVFITNFTLLNSMGYFAPSIDSLPLMHLWSLGIEEQFYIFWPLLLSLSFRWKKSISLVMIVALLSFAANLVSVYDNSIAGFYAPWCRVWEMAAGGLLAFRKPQSAFSDKRWDNTYAIAGTILLLIAVQLINRDKYFPGFWALLPVVGAVFLIRAGTETCLNR
ncbi:MAG TPA: acyltransferase [Pseudomonadales bacterium]|nr:acyltransferase [Pseudomonadales bacterium]